MSIDPMKYPEPPTREEWGFLNELKAREVRHVQWDRRASAGELDLSWGLDYKVEFPDEAGRLETAFDDLKQFAMDVKLPLGQGVPVRLVKVDKLDGLESYAMEVTKDGVTLTAEDTEGMRRAIYFFEDQLAGQDGPFLPLGRVQRKPWLKNRISRCFFGPIKRPPFNRDELMDDMDYYPDEYLNRLAHEGINGLWLTVVFREIAETSFTKRDKDAPQRLAKLRRTINQCLRYGIKTWIFSIEPRWLDEDDPILKEHPELAGAKGYSNQLGFCPSSPAGQQYLYETMKDIFTQLPGLGGLLNISHGERMTSCLSSIPSFSNGDIKCPRCSKIPKWQIFYNTVKPMIEGMRAANPEAEMISWLYQPQPTQVRGDWVYDIPEHVPDGVTLQYNFESGAQKKQLNRVRSGGDYWLSYTGPTEIFQRVADNAIKAGAKISAKIQVGCSHEVATVPFVSVPGLLYHKYKAMHKCGCTSVMQCWYFGNYPGIMNRAAGMLAFEDFNDDEEGFLLRLARPQWGRHAEAVSKAWKYFTEGYSNYPLSNDMQYYGPMHAGITWPMFFDLENKPLSPTWKPDFPPTGDTIGECLENHTLEEVLILTTRMVENWDKGMEILEALKKSFSDDRDRLLDIGVSKALGLQFNSARNIFEYYLLRRDYRNPSTNIAQKLADVEKMRCLLEAEMRNADAMKVLCEADSRLGFHSEAEAHQYCPARLAWRVQQISELIAGPVDEAIAALKQGKVREEQSEYIRHVAQYDASKAEPVRSGLTEWSVFNDMEKNEIVITLKSLAEKGSNDMFQLSIMDNYGTSFPWSIDVTRKSVQDAQGEWHSIGTLTDSNNVAAVDYKEEDGFWSATVRIPSLFWGDVRNFDSFYLYLRHRSSKGEAKYYYTWPQEAEPPRHRLNLFAFQADHCGRIYSQR